MDPRVQELEKLGIEPTAEKKVQYKLLQQLGQPITVETMSLPYEDVYRQTFGASAAEWKPGKQSEKYLTRDKDVPAQAMSPVAGQGMRAVAVEDMTTPTTTAGEPSALGSAVNKAMGAYDWVMQQPLKLEKHIPEPVTKAMNAVGADKIKEQALMNPADRRGLAGLAASALPRRYATPTGESIENPLMSLLRYIGLPSTVAATLAETVAEEVGYGTIPEDLKDADILERLSNNLIKNLGNIADLIDTGGNIGAKLGKDVDWQSLKARTGQLAIPGGGIISLNDAIVEAFNELGYVPDSTLDNYYKNKGRAVGSALAVPLEVMTPSTGEFLSIGRRVGKAGTEALDSLTKIPVPDEIKFTDFTEYQRVPEEEAIQLNQMYLNNDSNRAISRKIEDNPGIVEDKYIGPVHADHPTFAEGVAQPIDGETVVWKYHDVGKKAYSDMAKLTWEFVNATPGAKPADVRNILQGDARIAYDLNKQLLSLIGAGGDNWKRIATFTPERVKEAHDKMVIADRIIRSLGELQPQRWIGWEEPYRYVDINPASIELDKFGRPTDKAVQDISNTLEGRRAKLNQVFEKTVDLRADRRAATAIDDVTNIHGGGIIDELFDFELPVKAAPANNKQILTNLKKAYEEKLASIPTRWKYHLRNQRLDENSGIAKGIEEAFNELARANSFKGGREGNLSNLTEQDFEEVISTHLIDEFMNQIPLLNGGRLRELDKVLRDELSKILETIMKSESLKTDSIPTFIAAVYAEAKVKLADSTIEIGKNKYKLSFETDNLLKARQDKIKKQFDELDKLVESKKISSEIADAKKNSLMKSAMNKQKEIMNRLLATTYYELASSKAARELIAEIDNTKLNTRKLIDAGTASRLREVGLDPQQVFQSALQHIRPTKTGMAGYTEHLADYGVQDWVSDVATLRYGTQMLPDRGAAYLQTYQDLITAMPDLFRELRDNDEAFNIRELYIQLDKMLKTKSAQKELANLIETEPMFNQIFENLPKAVRERKEKTLIEKLTGRDKKDLPQFLNLAVNFLGRHAMFLKSSLLGGTYLPGLRYLTMNAMTGPLIVYQQLGMKSAIASLAELPNALEVLFHMKGRSIGRAKPLIALPGRELYTVGDIADIVTKNNLTGGSASFELTGNIIDDMMNHMPYLETTSSLNKIGKGIEVAAGISASPNAYNQLASDIDTAYRVGVLIDSLKASDSEAIAIRKARESLFDYGNLTDIERDWIAKYFFFYNFMRQNFVSAVRNLAIPFSGNAPNSRIKNQLRLIEEPLEYNEAETQYGSTRIKFPKGLTLSGPGEDKHRLTGPAVPIADGLRQISDMIAFTYFAVPMLGAKSSQLNTASEIFLDEWANIGVNPYLEAMVLAMTKGETDLRRRRSQTFDSPDERIVGAWKFFGLLNEDGSGRAGELFQLVPDTDRRYTGSSEDPKKRNRYKFANDEGKQNYAQLQQVLADTIFGISRSPRDWAYLLDPRFDIPVNVSNTIGLTTPLPKKTLLETQANAQSQTMRRYEEK